MERDEEVHAVLEGSLVPGSGGAHLNSSAQGSEATQRKKTRRKCKTSSLTHVRPALLWKVAKSDIFGEYT